jgi:hypothetical protein
VTRLFAIDSDNPVDQACEHACKEASVEFCFEKCDDWCAAAAQVLWDLDDDEVSGR